MSGGGVDARLGDHLVATANNLHVSHWHILVLN